MATQLIKRNRLRIQTNSSGTHRCLLAVNRQQEPALNQRSRGMTVLVIYM